MTPEAAETRSEPTALTQDDIHLACALTWREATVDGFHVEFDTVLDDPIVDDWTASRAAAELTLRYWRDRVGDDIPVHADGDEHHLEQELLTALRYRRGEA